MGITFEHSLYIQKNIGQVMAECVKDLLEARPVDPIDYMARWLYHHRGKDDYYHKKKLELQQAEEAMLEIARSEGRRQSNILELKYKIEQHQTRSNKLKKALDEHDEWQRLDTQRALERVARFHKKAMEKIGTFQQAGQMQMKPDVRMVYDNTAQSPESSSSSSSKTSSTVKESSTEVSTRSSSPTSSQAESNQTSVPATNASTKSRESPDESDSEESYSDSDMYTSDSDEFRQNKKRSTKVAQKLTQHTMILPKQKLAGKKQEVASLMKSIKSGKTFDRETLTKLKFTILQIKETEKWLKNKKKMKRGPSKELFESMPSSHAVEEQDSRPKRSKGKRRKSVWLSKTNIAVSERTEESPEDSKSDTAFPDTDKTKQGGKTKGGAVKKKQLKVPPKSKGGSKSRKGVQGRRQSVQSASLSEHVPNSSSSPSLTSISSWLGMDDEQAIVEEYYRQRQGRTNSFIDSSYIDDDFVDDEMFEASVKDLRSSKETESSTVVMTRSTLTKDTEDYSGKSNSETGSDAAVSVHSGSSKEEKLDKKRKKSSKGPQVYDRWARYAAYRKTKGGKRQRNDGRKNSKRGQDSEGAQPNDSPQSQASVSASSSEPSEDELPIVKQEIVKKGKPLNRDQTRPIKGQNKETPRGHHKETPKSGSKRAAKDSDADALEKEESLVPESTDTKRKKHLKKHATSKNDLVNSTIDLSSDSKFNVRSDADTTDEEKRSKKDDMKKSRRLSLSLSRTSLSIRHLEHVSNELESVPKDSKISEQQAITEETDLGSQAHLTHESPPPAVSTQVVTRHDVIKLKKRDPIKKPKERKESPIAAPEPGIDNSTPHIRIHEDDKAEGDEGDDNDDDDDDDNESGQIQLNKNITTPSLAGDSDTSLLDRVQGATWRCGLFSQLVCEHPVLGDLMPRPPMVPRETAEWWKERKFEIEALYDHETYSRQNDDQVEGYDPKKPGLAIQDLVVPGPWVLSYNGIFPSDAKTDQYTLDPRACQIVKLQKSTEMTGHAEVRGTFLPLWPPLDTGIYPYGWTSLPSDTSSKKNLDHFSASRRSLKLSSEHSYKKKDRKEGKSRANSLAPVKSVDRQNSGAKVLGSKKPSSSTQNSDKNTSHASRQIYKKRNKNDIEHTHTARDKPDRRRSLDDRRSSKTATKMASLRHDTNDLPGSVADPVIKKESSRNISANKSLSNYYSRLCGENTTGCLPLEKRSVKPLEKMTPDVDHVSTIQRDDSVRRISTDVETKTHLMSSSITAPTNSYKSKEKGVKFCPKPPAEFRKSMFKIINSKHIGTKKESAQQKPRDVSTGPKQHVNRNDDKPIQNKNINIKNLFFGQEKTCGSLDSETNRHLEIMGHTQIGNSQQDQKVIIEASRPVVSENYDSPRNEKYYSGDNKRSKVRDSSPSTLPTIIERVSPGSSVENHGFTPHNPEGDTPKLSYYRPSSDTEDNEESGDTNTLDTYTHLSVTRSDRSLEGLRRESRRYVNKDNATTRREPLSDINRCTSSGTDTSFIINTHLDGEESDCTSDTSYQSMLNWIASLEDELSGTEDDLI